MKCLNNQVEGFHFCKEPSCYYVFKDNQNMKSKLIAGCKSCQLCAIHCEKLQERSDGYYACKDCEYKVKLYAYLNQKLCDDLCLEIITHRI